MAPRRPHDKALDYQAWTFQGQDFEDFPFSSKRGLAMTQGSMRVKSKSTGSLRRGALGDAIEASSASSDGMTRHRKQLAASFPMRLLSSSKYFDRQDSLDMIVEDGARGKKSNEGAEFATSGERAEEFLSIAIASDQEAKHTFDCDLKLKESQIIEKPHRRSQCRKLRRGVGHESRIGPRSKSASCIDGRGRDMQITACALDLGEVPHAPQGSPAILQDCQEDFEKVVQAIGGLIDTGAIKHSERKGSTGKDKSAHKSKKSKKAKGKETSAAPTPVFRAQPGNGLCLSTHTNVEAFAHAMLGEADVSGADPASITSSLTQTESPSLYTTEIPKEAASRRVKCGDSLQELLVAEDQSEEASEEQITKLSQMIGEERQAFLPEETAADAILNSFSRNEEACARPSSAAASRQTAMRTVDPNPWNLGFDGNCSIHDDICCVWDSGKDVYYAWGGEDDWGMIDTEWDTVGPCNALD
jgi:hypothetical protein